MLSPKNISIISVNCVSLSHPQVVRGHADSISDTSDDSDSEDSYGLDSALLIHLLCPEHADAQQRSRLQQITHGIQEITIKV